MLKTAYINNEGLYEEVEILHWGIDYEIIEGGSCGHYTLVYVKTQDGFVKRVVPEELRFKESL